MRAGVPVLVIMKSFLLEAIFALGTAAVIAIPGTMYFIPAVIDHFFTWIVAFVVVLLVAFVVAKRFKLVGMDGFHLSTTLRSPGYVNVGLLYLLVWLISAAAHWCLANAVGDYSISHFPLLMVAVSASWALGFVSVFAPAGLGVREAVLYFFVNNWMEQTDGILFVTLSRLLMFGVELFLTGGFLLYSKVARPSGNGNDCIDRHSANSTLIAILSIASQFLVDLLHLPVQPLQQASVDSDKIRHQADDDQEKPGSHQ